MGKIDTSIKQLDNKWMTELTSVIHEGVIYARNGRRVAPTVAITDEPKICLVANKEWWAHIGGVVDALTERRAWVGADNDDNFAIQQILEFMAGVECMDFQLRQSPTDACILEQSLDGGQTWVEAYNFLLCEDLGIGGATLAVENADNTDAALTEASDAYQNYLTNYVNSIGDLYPDLVYDGSQNDGDRDRALCAALTAFIDAISDAAIAFYREKTESVDEVMLVVSAAVAVVGLAAIIATAGGFAAFALSLGAISSTYGLGSTLFKTIFTFLNNRDRDTFEDFAAREDAVCYLYDILKGSDADRDVFIASFSGASMGGNTQTIIEYAAILANEPAYYAVFANRLNTAYDASLLGLTEPCPCDTDLSVWYHDFSNDLGLFKLNFGSVQADGIHGVDRGDFYQVNLDLRFSHLMSLREVKLGVTRTNGIGSGTDDTDTVFYWADLLQDTSQLVWLGAGFAPNGAYVRCHSRTPAVVVGAIQIDLRVSDTLPLPDIILREVTLVFDSPASMGKIDVTYVLC